MKAQWFCPYKFVISVAFCFPLAVMVVLNRINWNLQSILFNLMLLIIQRIIF